MKYITLCFLITLALPHQSSGQNLVPNWSFEEVINCPTTLAALHHDCADWYFGIQLPGLPWNEWPSPDWYHTCSPMPGLTPPSLLFGYQVPFDGEAYTAFVTFDQTDPDYREIISVELDEQLTVGDLYSIKFQVVRAHKLQTGYATNNIGIKFSTFPYWLSKQEAISNWAHGNVEELIEDTLNWTLIEFQFVADSSYRHLHIGNFFTDENCLIENISQENYANSAYYLVDCVEVIKDVTSSSNSYITTSTPIYPNPAVDFISIPDEKPIRSVKVLDSIGRMVINVVEFSDGVKTIDISRLSEGIYTIEVENESSSVSFFKLIKTK